MPVTDLEQSRAEVLAGARALGDVLRRYRLYGGGGGDSGSHGDEIRARTALDSACVAYARALSAKPDCWACQVERAQREARGGRSEPAIDACPLHGRGP